MRSIKRLALDGAAAQAAALLARPVGACVQASKTPGKRSRAMSPLGESRLDADYESSRHAKQAKPANRSGHKELSSGGFHDYDFAKAYLPQREKL
jgi:hypothetical protein